MTFVTAESLKLILNMALIFTIKFPVKRSLPTTNQDSSGFFFSFGSMFLWVNVGLEWHSDVLENHSHISRI